MSSRHSTEQFYLLAVNFFDAARSRVICEIEHPALLAALRRDGFADSIAHVQLTAPLLEAEFVGGGYYIQIAARIAAEDDALCNAASICGENGAAEWFDVRRNTATFPLVEGKFAPGDYWLESALQTRATIGSLSELSAVVFGYTFLYAYEYKLRCTPERIELVSFANQRTLAVGVRDMSGDARPPDQMSVRQNNRRN